MRHIRSMWLVIFPATFCWRIGFNPGEFHQEFRDVRRPGVGCVRGSDTPNNVSASFDLVGQDLCCQKHPFNFSYLYVVL